MAYKILINYSSGDSGGSWECDEIQLYYRDEKQNRIPVEFENVNIAKENLQRIKKHNEFVCSYHGYYKPECRPVPDFIEKIFPNCVKTYTAYGKEFKSLIPEVEFGIPIKLDDGKEIICDVCWIGYFETLKSAKITQKEEDGWSFEL